MPNLMKTDLHFLHLKGLAFFKPYGWLHFELSSLNPNMPGNGALGQSNKSQGLGCRPASSEFEVQTGMNPNCAEVGFLTPPLLASQTGAGLHQQVVSEVLAPPAVSAWSP